jgi:hypothetical protein
MAIRPVCDKCGKELDEFGALIMSPPDRKGGIRKFHICVKCYNLIVGSFI